MFKLLNRLVLAIALVIAVSVSVYAQDQLSDPTTVTPAAGGLSFGFVIDNSGSARKLLIDLSDFTLEISEKMEPDDEAFFVRFVSSDKIKMDQEFTKSKSELRDAVEAMYIEGGQSALIDAVKTSANYLVENALAGENRTRALLVVSDGDERASVSKIEETIKILKEGKIRVIAVGVSDEKVYPKVLERLAKETGGRFFNLKTKAELKTIAEDVAAVLRKP